MPKRFLIVVLALVAGSPAAATATTRPFTAHADLRPSGCTQVLAGTVMRLTGCGADAVAGGTLPGRLRVDYSADVDIARGVGAQRGTLTLASASGKDVLVARFRGAVTMSTGLSRGRWTAVRRQGAFARLAAAGSYASRTPDRGVHVAFDVRG
jgi:hypothetical protein